MDQRQVSAKPARVSNRLAAAAFVVVTGGLLISCAASDSKRPTVADDATLDPLSQYLLPDPAVIAVQEAKRQQLIAECMRAEGFPYTATTLSPLPGDAGDGFYPPAEWTAVNGYGIVERTFTAADDAEASADPNITYFNALSAAERTAYEAALHGDSIADPQSLSWAQQGCTGRAEHDLAPQRGPRPSIIEDAAAFVESLEKDPQVTAIYADWRHCMKEAGFPEEDVPGQGFALQGSVMAYSEKYPAAQQEDAAVQKLKAAEITQALVDRDCAEEVDLVARRLDALAGLEQDYIAAHKKELEEAQLWLNG